MSQAITFLLDGIEIAAEPDQTILEAADAAGVYIPRLCAMKWLSPSGSCRICTVLVNGRPQAACTQPVAPGIVVENDTEQLNAWRRDLVEMLLVEGNHYCMFCEKSGFCELQALAYRFGITAPKYPYRFPRREVDASHPDVFLDRNRCVLCGRCLRASAEMDGKGVFGLVGRGSHRLLSVNAEDGLAGTDLAATDRAVSACPTGALLPKRVGFAVPVGQRKYDREMIGADIQAVRT
ncbi:MAG TPA: 2Fe-2S iron-sulfur cluster-binding protein [Phycisphaerae bacterium]|nr:2Fe-2S iron-sulfur cluster-binding protein [Phycisphaerae bacterium]HOM52141.1 2Fe-2S iron-sulfur cluster-binding protein [Phycisphaerae bacterium]HON66346.1 2Fe-2S iron-sulfur cluster-binding protein [Phycisphaerae bacterium]HPP27668.1 2Fe-2S iron-sulfur cluster-binding protein [Phycisphaerae bacterium]HPU27923.1 2Fe-2S iron-sulfur cluster-binding protein [Phycisphaerae bacterium]